MLTDNSPSRAPRTRPTPSRPGWRALTAACALAFSQVACSGSDDAPQLAPFDRAALEATVTRLKTELGVPGMVVLLDTPNGQLEMSLGTTTHKGSTPVSPDQHIRVGSNTKTWVGTVILQMVQEGKIALTDPVSRYRPDVPNGQNIRIEHLLNMRSGLFNYTEPLSFAKVIDADPLRVWDPEELVKLAYAQAPYFTPGNGYHYSNTNTVLLGLIAQSLDKKPLPDILRDRIFIPAGLTNTLFPATTSNAIPAPYANGYMFGNNELTAPNPPRLPQAMLDAIAAGTLDPVDHTFDNPSWGWAAGAGISTARDLFKWVRALGNGTLLTPEMQRIRLGSVRPTDPTRPTSADYGLGIARFLRAMYGHTGELPGYNSFMGHDPSNKVTLVIWVNMAPTPEGLDPATTTARTLLGQIYR